MDNKKSLNQKTKENFNFVEPPAFSGSMHETDSPYETSQAKEILQIFEPPTVPGSMHETGYPEDYDEIMGNFLFINPHYKNIPMQQPINPEMMSNTNRPYYPGFPRPYYNQYGHPYNPNFMHYGYYHPYYPYYNYPAYGFNPLPWFLLGSIIR